MKLKTKNKLSTILKRSLSVTKYCILLNPKLFSVQVSMIIISNMLLWLNLIVPKLLINSLIIENWSKAFLIAGCVFICNLIHIGLTRLVTPYQEYHEELINIEVINKFLEKSYTLQASFFDNEDAYNKYSISFDKCCDIVKNARDVFLQLFSSLLQITAVISIISWINPIIFLLMALVITLSLAIGKKTQEVQYSYQKSIIKQNRQMNFLYRVFHIPNYIRDIRINNLKEFLFKKKRKYNSSLLKQLSYNSKKLSNMSFIQNMLVTFENLFVTSYFIIAYIQERIWLDDFFVAINAYGSFKDAIIKIFSTWNSLYQNDLYITDYLEFMETNLVESSGELKLENGQIKSIEFKNVSFSYPNQNGYALENVNFHIKKTETVMIAGPNGSGKSTIVKLLTRLYSPDQGTILLNDIEISRYNLTDLRKSMSVLLQDYAIYPFSVKENILFNDESFPEAALNSLLSKVGMRSKIEQLKFGTQTYITSQMSDQGVELSGGENQRIAIARTLAHNSGFVICDEISNNLDPKIEFNIYKTMRHLLKSGILVIVSHQLFFAPQMDKILFFNDGRLIEEGTHHELLTKNSMYKDFYELHLRE